MNSESVDKIITCSLIVAIIFFENAILFSSSSLASGVSKTNSSLRPDTLNIDHIIQLINNCISPAERYSMLISFPSEYNFRLKLSSMTILEIYDSFLMVALNIEQHVLLICSILLFLKCSFNCSQTLIVLEHNKKLFPICFSFFCLSNFLLFRAYYDILLLS